MSAWAGFWIGCGLLTLAVSLGHIGDMLSVAADRIARAYEDSLCECDCDDNNEVPDDVQ